MFHQHCWYCGIFLCRKNRSIDHFIPKSYGGTIFVYACKDCNCLKDNATVEEFREYLANGGEHHVFYGEKWAGSLGNMNYCEDCGKRVSTTIYCEVCDKNLCDECSEECHWNNDDSEEIIFTKNLRIEL